MLIVWSAPALVQAKLPHLIMCLGDDYGWNNIGYRNPEIKTPHMDELASEYVRLERHYTYKYVNGEKLSLPLKSLLRRGVVVPLDATVPKSTYETLSRGFSFLSTPSSFRCPWMC